MFLGRLSAAAAALIVCTGVGGQVAGADTAGSAPSASNLDISSIPEAAVIDQKRAGSIPLYYPEVAAAQNVGGVAVMDCKMSSARGRLGGCVTIAESPPGCFFGAAAGKLAEVGILGAPASLLNDATQLGQVVRLKVTFPGAAARAGFRCRA
jgi:hypothetical protein